MGSVAPPPPAHEHGDERDERRERLTVPAASATFTTRSPLLPPRLVWWQFFVVPATPEDMRRVLLRGGDMVPHRGPALTTLFGLFTRRFIFRHGPSLCRWGDSGERSTNLGTCARQRVREELAWRTLRTRRFRDIGDRACKRRSSVCRVNPLRNRALRAGQNARPACGQGRHTRRGAVEILARTIVLRTSSALVQPSCTKHEEDKEQQSAYGGYCCDGGGGAVGGCSRRKRS
ncbi:hypothetical protein BC628DRAFT_138469 [Trametes gibbosa]|nr:hypothetical protein BC628DRAFT_138469 [Trametes gibbosa]